ncbi:hypothetical protein BDW22DRAFT_1433623 [Trametopsis cervina]|nr:hypothetical protein BDW22DRAFT_1433623 [Trametopsis cervina]
MPRQSQRQELLNIVDSYRISAAELALQLEMVDVLADFMLDYDDEAQPQNNSSSPPATSPISSISSDSSTTSTTSSSSSPPSPTSASDEHMSVDEDSDDYSTGYDL